MISTPEENFEGYIKTMSVIPAPESAWLGLLGLGLLLAAARRLG
jgi:hypothetical protein